MYDIVIVKCRRIDRMKILFVLACNDISFVMIRSDEEEPSSFAIYIKFNHVRDGLKYRIAFCFAAVLLITSGINNRFKLSRNVFERMV